METLWMDPQWQRELCREPDSQKPRRPRRHPRILKDADLPNVLDIFPRAPVVEHLANRLLLLLTSQRSRQQSIIHALK
jgi:hypothetical protein